MAFETQATVTHPRWTGRKGSGGDLALIILKSPARLRRWPTLRLLPQPSLELVEGFAFLAFAGLEAKTQPNLTLSDSLQELYFPSHQKSVCSKLYQDAGHAAITAADIICAGHSGPMTCSGNSGGPLILKGESWEGDVGIAIMTGGEGGCGKARGLPALFISVESYTADLLDFADGTFLSEHGGLSGGIYERF